MIAAPGSLPLIPPDDETQGVSLADASLPPTDLRTARARIRLAPSIGAARMDRAKTPTQSSLVTRIGGEERSTGGGGGVLACGS